MAGGRPRRFASIADALSALGSPDEPAFAGRAAAAGVGVVTVDEGGSLAWSDAAYLCHGRPRWRRVHRVDELLPDVVTGADALRAVYHLLASGSGESAAAVDYVSVDDHGVHHGVRLLPVGPRTALAFRSAPAPVIDLTGLTSVEEHSAREPALAGAGPTAAPAARRRTGSRATEPATADVIPEPQPVPEPIPEPAPAPGPEPIPVPAPEPIPVPPPEPAPTPEPDPVPDPIPAPATDTDPVATAVFEASPVAMAVLDGERLDRVNDAFCDLVHASPEELHGTDLASLLPDGGAEADDDLPLRRSDGEVRWVRLQRSAIDGSTSGPQILLTLQDVTESRTIADRLQRQALHDELTGLPNRRLLLEQLGQALSRSRRTNTRIAVFFIDVDDLKRVNDTHGHRGGDQLILRVGQALREELRESDTLARIGGDEFVAVCEDVGGGRTLDDVGHRFIASVRQPLVLDGATVPVSISVGVAAPRSPDESADSLLSRADAAMYRAKSAGGGRLAGGTNGWDTARESRPDMDEWLAALRDGALRLLYEPVVTADHGTLLGVVARLRWAHPVHGELTGSDLLETRSGGAATTAFIRWAVRKALAEVRTLNDTPLTVWMTVPSRALLQTTVTEEIADAYAALGGRRAPSLVLDIREKDLASLLRRGGPPQVMPGHSGEIPVSLGIDGFRGDAVPLGVLAKLAPRSIRLHSSLTHAAGRTGDPGARALLEGIVAAANSTGVTSIAAQVDDTEALRVAREVGVLAVQGAVVAPARSIDALTTVLHGRQVPLPDTGTAAVERPEAAPVPEPAVEDIGAALAAEIGLELPATKPVEDAPLAPAPTTEPIAGLGFSGVPLPPSPFLLLRQPPPGRSPQAGSAQP
ncbi:MAG TPA: diguanylate cyclase [Candidatus Nanopelagicales bacterium]|nr:diguanylate cyclase [Candidatus Nanopelagicales bacterium]